MDNPTIPHSDPFCCGVKMVKSEVVGMSMPPKTLSLSFWCTHCGRYVKWV